jgi:PhnB protein
VAEACPTHNSNPRIAMPSPSAATATKPVKPIPGDMHTVTPHLVCSNAAAAIEFYKKAFGAVECARLAGPDGKIMHASVTIGDSTVMLVDEFPQCGSFSPQTLKGSSVTLHLYVADAAAAAKKATAAGAKLIMPVQEMFWGDRYGVVEDPFGHRWSIATHVRDLTPAEIQEAARTACAGAQA